MKLLPLLFLTFIALSSCSTYKEYKEDAFPNFTWEAEQTVEFRPVIEDNSASYRLGLGLRHVFGFRQSKIRVSVRMISPSGVHSLKMYDLKVKDEDGGYVGSCAGDLCDLETIVDENITFEETGDYTVILTQHEGLSQVAGIMAVGLILDKN